MVEPLRGELKTKTHGSSIMPGHGGAVPMATVEWCDASSAFSPSPLRPSELARDLMTFSTIESATSRSVISPLVTLTISNHHPSS